MTTTAVTGPAARAVQVWKVYGAGETEVVALQDVSVDLERGKFTAIMGPSGSGKSTLMHCLAGLDSVSRGEVYVGGTRVTGLGDAGLTRLRRDKIGFIFQQFNLLPTLTAEENILLPLSIAGRKPDPQWYRTVIETVRLGDRLGHRPSQLSGGQQQRVACARALVARPEVIFADEPTGNLDSRSGADVLGFLRDSVQTHGQTIVMVTHDPVAASYADRVLFLADGAVVDEILEPTAVAVLDRMRTIDALDESPRGAAPVSGGTLESRGTTDPTGRTPHPGPPPAAGGGAPHQTNDEPRPGGGSAGPGNPGGPTARLADGPASGASHAVRIFAADNAGTATLTSTAPSTLTATTRATPQTPAQAPPPAQATPKAAVPAPQPAPTQPGPTGESTRSRPARRSNPRTPGARGPATLGNLGTATPDSPDGMRTAGPGNGTHSAPRATDATYPGAAPASPTPGTTPSATPGTPDKATPGDPNTVPDAGGQATSGEEAKRGSGAEAGERRGGGAPGRRKAVQRPAATRPPKGRPRKRASPPDQTEPNGEERSPAETTDGDRAEDPADQPRKATKRATPRKSTAAKRATKPRDAEPGTAAESTVDETK